MERADVGGVDRLALIALPDHDWASPEEELQRVVAEVLEKEAEIRLRLAPHGHGRLLDQAEEIPVGEQGVRVVCDSAEAQARSLAEPLASKIAAFAALDHERLRASRRRRCTTAGRYVVAVEP